MRKKILLLIILILFGVTIVGNLALAKEWEVMTWPHIPGYPSGLPSDATLPQVIDYFFRLGLATAGIVAFIVIVIGAVQFVASTAAPSARNDAKKRMTNAILGLFLIFASYIILNTINPELIMPGLMLGPSGGDISIGLGFEPLKRGVVIYEGTDCASDKNFYVTQTPIEDLSKIPLESSSSINFEDKAKSFAILDNGIIINFWEHKNYKGAVVTIEGPVKCLNFDEVSPPDLTEKISSINYQRAIAGVVLCKTNGPTGAENDCEFFPPTTGESLKEMTFIYGQKDHDKKVTLLTSGYYNIQDNDYAIKDNKARWIGVSGGFYGILCHDGGKDPAYCYYLLESCYFNEYGDTGPAAGQPKLIDNFFGNSKVSGLFIQPAIDNYCKGKDNCKSCKGVIFYLEEDFNRKTQLTDNVSESAAWPVGIGNAYIHSGNPHLESNTYNYTKVSDLTQHDEIVPGALGSAEISSFKIIGNCKMKVNGSEEFTKSQKNLSSGLDDAITSFVICNADDPQCPDGY